MSTTARRRLTEQERAERRERDRDREYALQAVEQLRSSDGWQQWLRTRASFHTYTPRQPAPDRDAETDFTLPPWRGRVDHWVQLWARSPTGVGFLAVGVWAVCCSPGCWTFCCVRSDVCWAGTWGLARRA